MAAISELLLAAGPYAGWVLSGLLGTWVLWMYSTDRLVSHGRHAEQATHYEQVLSNRKDEQARAMNQLRDSMMSLVEYHQTRSESLLEDRNYWREVGLDMMNALAAELGRSNDSVRDVVTDRMTPPPDTPVRLPQRNPGHDSPAGDPGEPS